MNLVLLSLLSQQQIELDSENPVIIGRKNVNECNDKRVSRNHGKISCTQDGKIILSALHSNPCFFTRNGLPPVLQINKDEEEVLNVGDCLGLLPDSFWFQVASKESVSKDSYQKNSHISITPANQSNTQNVDNKEKKENNADTKRIPTSDSDVKLLKDCKENKALNSQDNSYCNKTTEELCMPNKDLLGTPTCAWGYGNPEFEKTKRLPLYMYQIDEPINVKLGSRKTKSSETPQKVTPKKAKTETETTCYSVASTSNLKVESEVTESSGSLQSDVTLVDNISWDIPSTSGYSASQKHSQQSDCSNSKHNEESEEELKGREPDPQISKRPICQYEEKCYRKNPQHKVDFCHPGDTDYVPYEKRPMCQYGVSCYRRNEMHKVEFRHPPRSAEDEGDDVHSFSSSCSCPSPASSPLPAKRRRKQVKRHGVNSEADSDNDDYDLDDPFINDASSDDYAPEDSDAFDSGDD